MSYVISILFAILIIAGAAIMFYKHNQPKIDADIAKVQDIKSKL